MRTCVLRCDCFLFACPVLYLVSPFSFQPFLLSTSVFNERSRSNPLCDFRLGTVVTSDYETPLTGYEPKKDLNLTNAEELDLATTSDVYWQHTLDDDASLNDPNVDDNQLSKYLAVVVESTGNPVEMRSSNDQFSCDTRNLKGAQSQFPVVPQTEMICQTGGSVQARIAEEREKANAQIRTMLDEQRRTIIAEYSEKVLHHELLAAQAEQDRKVLQEELLRQQQDFREVHQQDLMRHQELQKFQNYAFDEFTQKKFVEDQKISQHSAQMIMSNNKDISKVCGREVSFFFLDLNVQTTAEKWICINGEDSFDIVSRLVATENLLRSLRSDDYPKDFVCHVSGWKIQSMLVQTHTNTDNFFVLLRGGGFSCTCTTASILSHRFIGQHESSRFHLIFRKSKNSLL